MSKNQVTVQDYIAPAIEIVKLQQEYHLLAQSEIKPTPGGPEVHDPDEDEDEEIEFE